MTNDHSDSANQGEATVGDSGRRFDVLHHTARQLAQISDADGLEQACDLVARNVEAQFGCEVRIHLFDPETRELVRVLTTRGDDDQRSLEDQLVSRATRERKTIVIEDTDFLTEGIGPRPRTRPDVLSLIITPLYFGDRYYGILELGNRSRHHFRDADVPLLEGLAHHLAITIYRLEEFEARRQAERRAAEAEVIGEIGRMTYEIAHRLGNNLGLLPKMLQRISKTLDDADALTPDLERRLSMISTRILDVLKLSRDLGELLANERFSERGTVPVAELIDDALAVLNLQERPDVTLVKEVDPDLGTVQAAHPVLVTAILNLLTNALEAIPDGGTIRVTAKESRGNVEIAVHDNGVGIAPAHLSNIFQLGYSTKSKSSGFGLWSTKRAIAQHGGTIEVESKPTRGSTFKIILPRTEPQGLLAEETG